MMNAVGIYMKFLKKYSSNIIMLAGGLFGGILLGMWIVHLQDRMADVSMLRLMAWALGGFYFSAFVQIILHEGGHLIAGLLSGYRFVSFRILSMIWVKKDDRIIRRKYSLAGTGGQCLLDPPGTCDDYPGVFYNLGGVIMNLLTALIAVVICRSVSSPLVQMVLMLFAGTGVVYALINGIPLTSDSVSNDGRNTLEIIRSFKAKKALWRQLRINALQSYGDRLKDMPEDLFEMPPEEDMKYSLCASIAVLRMARLIDEHRFPEALELMEKIRQWPAVPGVYRNQIIIEEVCMKILTGNTDPGLLSPEYTKALRTMKSSLSAQRTEYAVQKCMMKNEQKAAVLKKWMESMYRIWPYASEVQAEREMIELIDRSVMNDEYAEAGRETDESV